ncbi:molybdopterin biosynthesis protein MoeE [Nocardioides baekrokdamisoli]|uniref:Molybdopterin biosynthesis protein MoeE n=1 Tax=Nocardioides baekrokdamisoli TaxID=1804624 RepID=A0A3G9IZ36_9ACTN|nr:molybdenum cofactor biosynthesis protein MoaE [Nocardioides baekrokdamisoli]BBH16454.1 molybdopterin biosynthesis protein MoeE [Nocardioides baekrokdamisoli]
MPVRLLDIRETPLDVAEVVSALGSNSAGGLNIFVGMVRDHDHGRGVTGLGYSAHPTALGKLAEVAERIADRHGVDVAAVHRIGDLAIGDIAVIVATTAAHRGAAFDATRDLIDTLKSEVPIWKHQRFADGAEEWVGLP